MSDMPDAGPTGPVPDEDVTLPLAATAGVVKSRLTDDLAARRATYGGIDPSVDATLGILEDFVLSGGKRVRPTFAWAGVRLALDGVGPTTPTRRPARSSPRARPWSTSRPARSSTTTSSTAPTRDGAARPCTGGSPPCTGRPGGTGPRSTTG